MSDEILSRIAGWCLADPKLTFVEEGPAVEVAGEPPLRLNLAVTAEEVLLSHRMSLAGAGEGALAQAMSLVNKRGSLLRGTAEVEGGGLAVTIEYPIYLDGLTRQNFLLATQELAATADAVADLGTVSPAAAPEPKVVVEPAAFAAPAAMVADTIEMPASLPPAGGRLHPHPRGARRRHVGLGGSRPEPAAGGPPRGPGAVPGRRAARRLGPGDRQQRLDRLGGRPPPVALGGAPAAMAAPAVAAGPGLHRGPAYAAPAYHRTDGGDLSAAGHVRAHPPGALRRDAGLGHPRPGGGAHRRVGGPGAVAHRRDPRRLGPGDRQQRLDRLGRCPAAGPSRRRRRRGCRGPGRTGAAAAAADRGHRPDRGHVPVVDEGPGGLRDRLR